MTTSTTVQLVALAVCALALLWTATSVRRARAALRQLDDEQDR
ncbi:hypothetical protein [Amycolatopsis suaedae]|nr:hypothetical protein [Amycolatopsis suaedae]